MPVKRLAQAKSRLAPHMSEADRREVATALLEDALTLCDSVGFLDWWIVTADDEVESRARARGFSTIPDDGDGLNASLTKAVAVLAEKGSRSVTIVPADIPLAWAGDLQDLHDTGATSDMVLVPAEGDGGTNGLFLTPPDLIQPLFGEASLQEHLAEAERRRLRCALLNLPRLALDIDTLEDAQTFLQRAVHPSHTLEALRALGLPAAPSETA